VNSSWLERVNSQSKKSPKDIYTQASPSLVSLFAYCYLIRSSASEILKSLFIALLNSTASDQRLSVVDRPSSTNYPLPQSLSCTDASNTTLKLNWIPEKDKLFMIKYTYSLSHTAPHTRTSFTQTSEIRNTPGSSTTTDSRTPRSLRHSGNLFSYR
jgi:hypothetical protein